MLGAAILLFEPTSPERFLPVLPFLLLAVAAGLDSRARMARLAKVIVCLFAILLPVMNFSNLVQAYPRWRQQVARQVAEFHSSAAPDDAALIVTMLEPLQQLPQHPFDPLNRAGGMDISVALGNTDVPTWQAGVAQFVLAAWAQGKAAWVEKAALADAPAERLLWVEGDSPNLHWRDVPSFFHSLAFDKETAGADGFQRISRTAGNEALLRRLAD